MSSALKRLGRFADRTVRRDLEDPFEAPGLDSHRATELLAQAGSAKVGLGAEVVLTPRDPETSCQYPSASTLEPGRPGERAGRARGAGEGRRGRAQHGPTPAVMTSPGNENGDHNHDHRHPTS